MKLIIPDLLYSYFIRGQILVQPQNTIIMKRISNNQTATTTGKPLQVYSPIINECYEYKRLRMNLGYPANSFYNVHLVDLWKGKWIELMNWMVMKFGNQWIWRQLQLIRHSISVSLIKLHSTFISGNEFEFSLLISRNRKLELAESFGN